MKNKGACKWLVVETQCLRLHITWNTEWNAFRNNMEYRIKWPI